MANTKTKNTAYWLEKIYNALVANTSAIEAQTEAVEALQPEDVVDADEDTGGTGDTDGLVDLEGDSNEE